MFGQINVITFDFSASKAKGTAAYICDLSHLFFSYIPVYMAYGIILGVLYPYWFFFINEVLILGAPQHPWYPTLFTTIVGAPVALLVMSFIRATITSPGYVTKSYANGLWQHRPKVVSSSERQHYHDEDHVAAQLTRERELRYCTRCQIYKPDLVHHCHDCDRCVLRADHHCPWVNNCVGRENIKFFNLFLFYIYIAGFAVSLSVLFVYRSENIKVMHDNVSPLHHAAIIASAICAACIALVFFFFSLSHMVMAATGSTSYSMARQAKTGEGKVPASFIRRLRMALVDAGQRSKVVLGDRGPWWHAFLPIAPQWAPYQPVSEVHGVDVV